MNVEELRSEFEKKWDIIKKFAGDYQCEVTYYMVNSALTRFANNIIHQNVAVQNGSLSIRLIKGKKSGKVDIPIYSSPQMIEEAVEAAKEITDKNADDEELLPLLGPQKYRELSRFCDKTAELDPEKRAQLVEKAAKKCAENNLSAAGIARNGWSLLGIANTNGLFAFSANTSFIFSITVSDTTGTGWAEGMGWSIDHVDVDSEIKEAVEIALRNQNPKDLEPGKYTVILTPAAVADILSFLSLYGFNARMHFEGRSFLKGKLGEKVFSELITIIDDVYDERWSGLPFDFEGVPRKSVVLVENGVLKGLVYDRLTAKKMNAEPTGHGLPQPNRWGAIPLNIIVKPGENDFASLIKSVKHGLLVTHFHYTNVSELTKLTITGMTRDGLFVVENGEIAYPVKNMRFTQSIAEALNNVVAVAKEQKMVEGFFFGGAITPGMIIDGFNFSSKTEFGG